MKKSRKIFLYIFVVLLIAGGFVGWKLFGPTLNTPEGNYLYIRTGSAYQQVLDSLKANHFISGTFWFDKVAGALNYKKNIKPGRYKITEGMSLLKLVRMLRAGKQSPVNLVITKIRTKEDLANRIGNNFEPGPASILEFLNNPDSLAHYDLDTNTVMTAVIPNTYSLNWNNKPSRIFRKLFYEQGKFWTGERKQKAARLGLSNKEVYTLASIIEEETNEPEDKGKIASVYLNRLRTGMSLAADPTVKFAMKDFRLKRVLNVHTRYVSPYNTYIISGLPPGPICTPSIKTIDAVLDSPETDYLYFVARSDFSGFSDFSSTYQQHMIYARAYQNALDSLFKKKSEK